MIKKATVTKGPSMESFMGFIREKGFKGCPICGNNDDFTWAHSAEIPGEGAVQMTAHIPGTTTVPNSDKVLNFPTPVIMIICDNCCHIMMFSEAMYIFK